jgi:hypothetical protein
MTRTLSAVMFAGLLLAAPACDQKAPPPAPPPAAPPAPPPAKQAAPQTDAGPAKPKMVANTDGLSLAERIAKREAAEKKLAIELAAAERDRLVKYDRSKLPLHNQTFAFITKTRERYDALEKKLPDDKAKAKAEVEKLAGSLRPGIAAADKKMSTIDPKGGNSNVTTDYSVMLNALANDYPDALLASLDGDAKALQEQKTELDKRTKKITDWLAELKKK